MTLSNVFKFSIRSQSASSSQRENADMHYPTTLIEGKTLQIPHTRLAG